MCPPCTWSSTAAPALAFRLFRRNFTAPLSTCPPATLSNWSLRSTHKTEWIVSLTPTLWKYCQSPRARTPIQYSMRSLAASAMMELTSASVPRTPPLWAQACPAQRGMRAWDSRIKSQTALIVICLVASPAPPAQILATLWKELKLPGYHPDHKLKRFYVAARPTPVKLLWQPLHELWLMFEYKIIQF